MFWRRAIRLLFLVSGLWSLVSSPSQASITFTGNAATDFPSAACMADPGGQDVGIPQAFPRTQISGFDIKAVCFSFDAATDTLYLGLQTFPDVSGRPIIFGDADGDGDPAGTSITLQNLLGQDLADLDSQEYFTFVLDMDHDGAPDLVVGTHTSNSLSQFQAVGGVAAPDNNLLLAPLPRFYGTAVAGVTATLPFFPSSAKPHLEFSISGVSQIPGYASLNLNDPDSYFQLYLSTGSLADDGIAEEYFPNIASYKQMKVSFLKDTDGDTINDALDPDNDNDTIPDTIENPSGSSVDTDGDGAPDYLDTDSDNDGIPDALEAGNPPGTKDSDGDGIPDFRETDSDGDGVLDNVEDANKNGKVDFGETDPTKADTDGDGLCDGTLVVGSCTGSEVLKGTSPTKVDTDGDGLCDGSVVVSPCVNSEGNLKTDPLNSDTDGDGILDGQEFSLGMDPLRPDLPPQPSTVSPPSSSNPSASAASSGPLGGDVDLTQGPVRTQGGGCSVVPGGFSFGGMFWWVFLTFWFGFVPKVWGLNVDHYRSNSDGLGFLNAESAKTLPEKEFSFGLAQHITHNPLEFGLTSNGKFLDNIVSYFYVWDLWGAFGLFENLDVALHLPVNLTSQIEDLTSTIARTSTSLGDLGLQAKWHFLEDFSLMTFLNFPTGSTADFFSDGKVTGGLKIIGDHSFGDHEVNIHLGAFVRDSETVAASGINLLEAHTEMLWGVGWRWPFYKMHQWYVMTHLWGQSDFDSEATSPVEWDFGFQKRFDKQPIEATLGLGFGMNKGYGNPDYRLVFGLNYVSRRPGQKDQGLGTRDQGPKNLTQAKLEGKEIVVLQPIHFEVNRAVIRPESFSILDDVAKLLERNRTILKVAIEGHTDSDGSDAFNLRLSEARAKAVRNYLIRQGVETRRLESKGWGESHPMVAGDTPDHKLQNRRVEFHVVEVER